MKEQNKQAAKNKKMNWIFAGVILVLALGLVAWGWISSQKGEELCAILTYLTQDGVQEMTIPLDEDKTYDVQTFAQEIHIQVKDGAVAFVESPCHDHVCETFGWLKNEGSFAMCAPNQAFLEIANPAER